MADLALAPAKPAASPIAAMLAATPAKGATPAAATDPFAILMAAAAPAAPTPLALLQLGGEPKATAVAEKTVDGETAKDDSDKAADPDALLALLTTPAPVAAPAPIAPPIATARLSVPVSDAPAAPVTKTTPPIILPAVIARTSAPVADPAPSQAPAAPATQTSIAALVQMMTAQADPGSAPPPIAAQVVTQDASQPIAAQVVVQPAPLPIAMQVVAQAASQPTTAQGAAPAAPQPIAVPLVATPTGVAAVRDEAAPAFIAQASPAIADVQARPIARSTRFLAPKLDAARTVTAKTQPEARPVTTEATDLKAPRRHDRDTDTRAATDPTAQPQQQDIKAAPRETATVTIKAPDLGSTDAVVTRHLAVAKDGQWLDSLAKDIAATGGNSGSLSFTLSPENLGALKVDITQGSDGASVHLTTDNDTARNIILDAQPRLAAEARAQGLTLKETSVSTNSDSPRQASSQQQASAQSNDQPGQDRRAFAQPSQPIAPTLHSPADEESDGELYA